MTTNVRVSPEPERTLLAAVPMAQIIFGLSRGVLPNVLCDTAGVPAQQLTDRDRWVPHAWHNALWLALREHCKGVAAGIEFGKFMSPDHLGYAGQVFRHARDGLDLLHKLARFGGLFDSRHAQYPGSITVDERTVLVKGAPEIPGEVLECTEASMVGFVTHLTNMTGVRPRILEVHIHLADQRHRSACEAFFECPIHFGTACDGLVIDRDSLRAPLLGANLAAAESIDAYVAQTLAPTRAESFAAKLRWAVEQQLHDGAFSQEEVARSLGLGVRTLQRRLASDGITFIDVVEDVRRAQAQRMLDETDAAVYEVAFCLGYQDVSSFNRAFKRWHGVSPRAYRMRKNGASQGS